MADARHRLVGGEHLGLDAEEVLILAVVHLGIAGGHHQNGILPDLEAHGLGDARALDADGDGRQLHRGAGYVEFTDAVGHAVRLQIGSYLFHRHDTVSPFI